MHARKAAPHVAQKRVCHIRLKPVQSAAYHLHHVHPRGKTELMQQIHRTERTIPRERLQNRGGQHKHDGFIGLHDVRRIASSPVHQRLHRDETPVLHNRGSAAPLCALRAAFHGSLVDEDDIRGDFALPEERFPAVKPDLVEEEGKFGELAGGEAGKDGVAAHALGQAEPLEPMDAARRLLHRVEGAGVGAAQDGDVPRGDAHEAGGIGGEREEAEERERVARFDGGFAGSLVELPELEGAAEEDGEQKLGGAEGEEVAGDVVRSSGQSAARRTSPCAAGGRAATRRTRGRADA